MKRVLVAMLAAGVFGLPAGLHAADVDGPAPSPLRVSDNGRMLVDATSQPVFLLGDTAWSLAMRLNREDAESYLRQRRAQLFNAVTFVLFAPGQNELQKRFVNAYGDPPFELTSGVPDPTRPITSPGANPANVDEYDYWDHVDHVVTLAGRLGLYVIMLPTWGSGVTGSYDGSKPDGIVFNPENARTYGRWLGQRYSDKPHVIWMLGGDRSAVYGERDFRPVFRAMAEGISSAAPGKLISYHPRKAAPQSAEWFHADRWLAFNSVQEWPDKQIAHMTADGARKPAKPTWLFEGRYEGYWKGNYKAGDWGEWQCRQQAYQTILAGAFGHTYGHERIFGFGLDGANWRDFMDTPGARSMTHLARLMNGFQSRDRLERLPDPSLIAGDTGTAGRTKSDHITPARTTSGRQAILYTASGRPISVRLEKLAPGGFFAWWFNPREGKWHVDGAETNEPAPFARNLTAGPGAGVREFVPPTRGEGQDWVLILSASERM